MILKKDNKEVLDELDELIDEWRVRKEEDEIEEEELELWDDDYSCHEKSFHIPLKNIPNYIPNVLSCLINLLLYFSFKYLHSFPPNTNIYICIYFIIFFFFFFKIRKKINFFVMLILLKKKKKKKKNNNSEYEN
jgi:hypothetical protein